MDKPAQYWFPTATASLRELEEQAWHHSCHELPGGPGLPGRLGLLWKSLLGRLDLLSGLALLCWPGLLRQYLLGLHLHVWPLGGLGLLRWHVLGLRHPHGHLGGLGLLCRLFLGFHILLGLLPNGLGLLRRPHIGIRIPSFPREIEKL